LQPSFKEQELTTLLFKHFDKHMLMHIVHQEHCGWMRTRGSTNVDHCISFNVCVRGCGVAAAPLHSVLSSYFLAITRFSMKIKSHIFSLTRVKQKEWPPWPICISPFWLFSQQFDRKCQKQVVWCEEGVQSDC